MIHPLLKAQLEPLARRQHRLKLWSRLTACWAIASLAGLAVIALQGMAGWSAPLSLPLVALAGFVAAVVIWFRTRQGEADERSLARQVETAHPELDGRLITAVQQKAGAGDEFTYLQQRVLDETLACNRRSSWTGVFPASRLRALQLAHICALALFAAVLWGLRVPSAHGLLLVAREAAGIMVTPGDVTLERGSSLVVMARFQSVVPGKVDLVLESTPGNSHRVPLIRSLADPLFGGTVPEIMTNAAYHLEYAGHRTRDYRVTVFEYPRLERSDADLRFPEYTGQPPRHIDNTRRLSAVEGSELSLNLHLNKAVVLATLRSRNTNRLSLPLRVDGDHPSATLTNYPLMASGAYDLVLVDDTGRTNKLPADFVFSALKNRTPEIKVSSPTGDTRPSPLEEISFDGTVWDDFGVRTYGLAYAVPGKEPRLIELGQGVPAKEKRQFHFLLRMEELGLQPDDLVSWFVWADDIGPDAKLRRSTSDMFFAEVRPFEQVFREGQSMVSESSQQQQEQQDGGAGGPAEHLADMQKQIISATWNVFRQQGLLHPPANPASNTGPKVERGRTPVLPAPPGGQVSPRAQTSSEFLGDQGSRGHSPSHQRSWATRPSGGWKILNASVMGQVREEEQSGNRPSRRSASASRTAPKDSVLADPTNNIAVLRDAQAQALEQARAAREGQSDPRTAALWEAVAGQMAKALEKLRAATNAPTALPEALAAEQAAYQSLLKLQERELSVSRSRSRQRNQSGRQQQMQRQLEQLDLARDEDRYETEQQARAPQDPGRRDQLQVVNRLQELARRQQDVNERLKELQTALQEARTEKEREEVRRQLKRLQEQEREMLADADELRQIMDRPENQSRMAEQRQRLDQARNDLQRATESTRQEQPSQALASGTRAQQELQNLRNDMRRQSASEFDDELRQMRTDARELARRQEDIQKQIGAMNNPGRRTLTDADLNQQTLQDLARQRERLTNLVQNATQLSQQAEDAEPLMSRELYDTLRKFSQSDLGTLKQFQEDLMNRGIMSRDLYDRLKRTDQESGAKSLDLTGEMLRQGLLREADLAEQRARGDINELKRGVERAAESVVGDDAESLRQARERLDTLARQLEREISQAERGRTNDSAAPAGLASGQGDQPQDRQEGQTGNAPRPGPRSETGAQAGQQGDQPGQQTGSGSGQRSPNQPGRNADENQNANVAGDQPAAGNQDRGQAATGQTGTRPQAGADGLTPDSRELSSNQQQGPGTGQRDRPRASLSDQSSRGGDRLGNRAANGGGDGGLLDRLFDGRNGQWTGPITGDNFAPWSDGLREVEELIDAPTMRNDVAQARERARQIRQDYKRSQKKPDWATVRLQVVKPLVEVSNQIGEELARREPRNDLVPIDRDPVPGRYSELVRRYYEQLGKGNTTREAPSTNPRN
jgi:hypothetical protein